MYTKLKLDSNNKVVGISVHDNLQSMNKGEEPIISFSVKDNCTFQSEEALREKILAKLTHIKDNPKELSKKSTSKKIKRLRARLDRIRNTGRVPVSIQYKLVYPSGKETLCHSRKAIGIAAKRGAKTARLAKDMFNDIPELMKKAA